MHENRPLDDILEVNERMGSSPPDRQRFETDLEGYHNEMKNIKTQIITRCKKCSEANPIESDMRIKRDQLRKDLTQLKVDGDKTKVNIENQRKKQLDLEKDCRIRNKDQLDRLLGEHEARYKRNLSARDEQALVTEIDALKRNRKQLDSLAEIIADRKEMDQVMEDNRQQKHKVYFELTSLQAKFKEMKTERRVVEHEIMDLKRQLQCANERRRNLIDAYEFNREEYKTWLNENKLNGNSVPMSFPSARKIKAPIDVEELEPYYEQKRDCNRLINYLERLQNFVQKDEKAPTAPQIIDDDDDSADELPPQLMKQKNLVASTPASNPSIKRSLKKGAQPISHSIDIYNLFVAVEVDVPKLYSDVGESLAAVKEKLEFYNQQTTNELDWGDELGGMELLSISRTASDMDSSFMDDSISDVGSISSFMRASSRTSCTSPLANDNSPKRFVPPLNPAEVKNTPV